MGKIQNVTFCYFRSKCLVYGLTKWWINNDFSILFYKSFTSNTMMTITVLGYFKHVIMTYKKSISIREIKLWKIT